MFKDERRSTAWQRISQFPLQSFNKILTPDLVRQAAGEADVRVGNGPLNVVTLTFLAVFSAVHILRNFAEVLTMTLKLLEDADQSSRLTPQLRGKGKGKGLGKPGAVKGRKKHDPRKEDPTHLSEEAFVQARSRMPLRFWLTLILLLGEKFNQRHGQKLRMRGHRLLAIDGTTLRLENRRELREHFGTAANGKSPRSAQARMVMLSYPMTRICCGYELCPLKRSEKTCAMSLLSRLLPRDLVLMDKGFWSYGIFHLVATQQAYFGIRHFASAKLKTIRRYGKNDTLVSYAPSDRKWKDLPRPMMLRKIAYQVKGFRATSLVTNLLDRTISAQQWTGLLSSEAGMTLDKSLYHQRWGIETIFMELKVHQRMDGNLRGRKPETIQYEVAGHVLLHLLLRWLMVEAALESGVDPLRLSSLQAMRELLDITPLLCLAQTRAQVEALVKKLLARMAGHVVPLRPGRHYPRPGEMRTKYKGKGHYKRPSKLKPA